MTKRPNDQKDVDEPAFSPDGRYLYYSQDVTPGSIFQYDKDPQPAGSTPSSGSTARAATPRRCVTGPGGAVRPTPSPDGKQLAFIRRVRGKSVLHLRDLRSGEQWPIYDRLDRDMQEAWAIHGVYPGLSWTPDSKALVLWAGGKIWKLDAATRQAAEIPFHVESTRRLSKALRFPVKVAPERFDVKMLRWVEVAPAGDKVVYQALGHLWLRGLPDGTPKRLTDLDDRVELYPSFSRDGRSIVFSTWNDRELGSVRTIGVDGSGEKVLTREPGHYLEPVYSPDGQWVVYRKDDRRQPAHRDLVGRARDLPRAGGRRRPERVVKRGTASPTSAPAATASTSRPRRATATRASSASASTARTKSRSCRARRRPSSASRRTAAGWPSPSSTTPTSRRSSPPGWSPRSARRARRSRSPASPRTPANRCAGRGTASGSTGRSGRSSTRATCRTPSPSSKGRRRPCRRRRPRGRTSPSRGRPTCPRARWRSSAAR